MYGDQGWSNTAGDLVMRQGTGRQENMRLEFRDWGRGSYYQVGVPWGCALVHIVAHRWVVLAMNIYSDARFHQTSDVAVALVVR